MKPVEIVREVPLPPAEVFSLLTDWERHADIVPLTTVRRTDSGFVARTGVGRFAFDDPMDVVEWDPPRLCRLEKRGRVITGWAEITVSPTPNGSEVIWRELVHVTGVPGLLSGVERAAATAMFRRLLDGLTRT